MLRRQSLIGDAISHVALPGIVAAFLLTGTIATLPMLAGAIGAAVVAAVLIELVKRAGGVEPGAAMGVVFTTLFAAGVLLLELSDARSVQPRCRTCPVREPREPDLAVPASTPPRCSIRRRWPTCRRRSGGCWPFSRSSPFLWRCSGRNS